MDNDDIPLLKKLYDLYKTFHLYRLKVPKHDRHTIYEKAERVLLTTIEYIYQAGYSKQASKSAFLEKASANLNLLRLFIRLMKDTQTLDLKKYTILQEHIDETGRMLGGWLRSVK
jgi:hypothetical protein